LKEPRVDPLHVEFEREYRMWKQGILSPPSSKHYFPTLSEQGKWTHSDDTTRQAGERSLNARCAGYARRDPLRVRHGYQWNASTEDLRNKSSAHRYILQ
jgi:hypothetical protein